MTVLEKEILALPKVQKISIMERIWADLLKEEEALEVPSWHLNELEETERRLREGSEHFQDWDSAKQTIREE